MRIRIPRPTGVAQHRRFRAPAASVSLRKAVGKGTRPRDVEVGDGVTTAVASRAGDVAEDPAPVSADGDAATDGMGEPSGAPLVGDDGARLPMTVAEAAESGVAVSPAAAVPDGRGVSVPVDGPAVALGPIVAGPVVDVSAGPSVRVVAGVSVTGSAVDGRDVASGVSVAGSGTLVAPPGVGVRVGTV